MRKLLNNPVAVGALVLLALGLAFWPQLQERFAARSTPRPPILPADSDPALATLAVPSSPATAQRIRDDLATLTLPDATRDPFSYHEDKPDLPPVAAEDIPVQLETIHLSALWRQSGADLALLNNRPAAAGDRLGSIEVKEITAEGVWLQHDAERVFLALGQDHTFESSPDNPVPATP